MQKCANMQIFLYLDLILILRGKNREINTWKTFQLFLTQALFHQSYKQRSIIYYLCVCVCVCLNKAISWLLERERHPSFMMVLTPTHTHVLRIPEPFLSWSKRGDMKSNKSCMVAGGRRRKHGDVQVRRDGSVWVCACEWRRTRPRVTGRNKAYVCAGQVSGPQRGESTFWMCIHLTCNRVSSHFGWSFFASDFCYMWHLFQSALTGEVCADCEADLFGGKWRRQLWPVAVCMFFFCAIKGCYWHSGCAHFQFYHRLDHFNLYDGLTGLARTIYYTIYYI